LSALRPLALVALLWAVAAGALAGPAARTEHVTATLLAEHTAVEAPGTLWLGLRLDLIPHWHVYWRNPGDSGRPPTIVWDLPPGWSAGPIHWPVPRRIPVQHLTNYGYEGSVTLMVPVRTTPLGDARSVTLTADARWLVCREECVPEAATLSLTLPLGAGAPDSEVSAHFNRVRDTWPRPLERKAHYRLEGNTLMLDLPPLPEAAGPLAGLWFAAHDWGPVDPGGQQPWTREDDRLRLEVPAGDLPPDGGPLAGLLVAETARGPPRGFTLEATAAAPATEG
jgi:thiol:disulfide interchange protein DsbD